LAAEMSVLKGISEALANHTDIDEALRHTLATCFDAGGISLGALLLREEHHQRVLNFGFSGSWTEEDVQGFFGEAELLSSALQRRESTVIIVDRAPPAELRMLQRAGAAWATIIPIRHNETVFGALLMLSQTSERGYADRVKFGEAVAGEISQALAVAHAFREQEISEREARKQTAILQSVLDSMGDGVCVADGQGETMLWNSAARPLISIQNQAQTRLDNAGMFEPDTVTPVAADQLPLARALRGEAVDSVELFVRHDGAPDGVWLSATGRPWRDEEGMARGAVVVFRDVTKEKATHAQLMVSDKACFRGDALGGRRARAKQPVGLRAGKPRSGRSRDLGARREW